MENKTIRLSGVVRESIVDGPGLRLTVFTQGCPHRCPGCHNPQTHDFDGGYDCAVDLLLWEMDRNPLLKGLTLSGGEPFSRAEELLPFVEQVRARGKDIFCYSGYTFEEILALGERDSAVRRLLEKIDVLVDGRFILAERDLQLRFRGSANQRILDIPRSLEAGKAIAAQLEN